MSKPALTVTNGREYQPHPRVVRMTPALAEKILEANPLNRPLRSGRVERYAKSMREGRWRMNGATIVIAKGGDLLDGQHRLWAIIESQQTIDMLVVEGIDPDVFATIDTGRPRSANDVFATVGLKNNTTLTSALRWLAWYETPAATRQATPGHMGITHDALLDLAADNPDFDEAASTVASTKNARRIVTQSIVCFVYAMAARTSPADAGAWLAHLDTGTGLDAKHPVLQLRERMLTNKLSTGKLPVLDICALAIKSWNQYYTGKRTVNLRWSSQEAFPEFAKRSPRSQRGE